jgi:hypothetical protein
MGLRFDKVDILRRLEFYSMPVPECGCQIWLGAWVQEYGRLWVDGAAHPAHRVSWEAHNGPIPDGLWVLHWCDTPPCIRPDHLFLGTHRDNMDDMVSKNRQTRLFGSGNPEAKLIEADIPIIRSSTETQRALAVQYGVTQRSIWQIKTGKTWGHVP